MRWFRRTSAPRARLLAFAVVALWGHAVAAQTEPAAGATPPTPPAPTPSPPPATTGSTAPAPPPPASPAAASAAPAAPAGPPAAATAPATPAAETPPAAPPEDWGGEPFAFADFTWLEGNSRQHKAVLDTPYFTPEFLVDVNYTNSTAQPIDNTVVGSTSLSRNNEITLSQMAVGGDFHYEHAQGRLMLQYGMRSTLVPRNDGSSFHGQFDLQTALRYVAEAYGGYHWNVMHGINIQFGIFMSYIGLYLVLPGRELAVRPVVHVGQHALVLQRHAHADLPDAIR